MHKSSNKKSTGPSAKRYLASFLGGYTAGIAGELLTAYQNNKFNSKGISHYSFKDNCIVSGTQQVAKDFVKATFNKNPQLYNLSKTNPLVFGALTALPMVVLTQIVAKPLRNSHNYEKNPFDDYFKDVVNDTSYYIIKNGLDEYFASKVYPTLLPKIDSIIVRKMVEGAVSGAIGGSSYLFACPMKSLISGQSIHEAFDLFVKNTSKAALKKITYSSVIPKYVSLLK